MQKLKWILCFFLWILGFGLQAQELTPNSEISLLTFGPGTEVYAIWGHTAIRVKDRMSNIDKVYNYGTYDFDTPNFLVKFIRGKLDYTLSTQRYYRVIRAYKNEKRWIKEQVLNLTFEERQNLYELLEENYLEENRYYKYDFLFDNCATRPLEIIEKSIADSIDFQQPVEQSYRDILDEHLIYNPWADFGIDLIIGSLADVQASARQQMFMPVYILRYFQNGYRFGDQTQPLIAKEKDIAQEGDMLRVNFPEIIKPFPVMLFLLVLEIVLLVFTLILKRRIWRFYDILWYVLIFLGSLLVLFLWFGTDHIPTRYNWNIWWLNPLFIFLLPFFPNAWQRNIAKILFVFLVAFLVAWFFIPQQFHLAVLPLIGILGIKTYKTGFLGLK